MLVRHQEVLGDSPYVGGFLSTGIISGAQYWSSELEGQSVEGEFLLRSEHTTNGWCGWLLACDSKRAVFRHCAPIGREPPPTATASLTPWVAIGCHPWL